MDINPQLHMVMAEWTVVCLADMVAILEKGKKKRNESKVTTENVGANEHSREKLPLIPFRLTNICCARSGLNPGNPEMKQTRFLPPSDIYIPRGQTDTGQSLQRDAAVPW